MHARRKRSNTYDEVGRRSFVHFVPDFFLFFFFYNYRSDSLGFDEYNLSPRHFVWKLEKKGRNAQERREMRRVLRANTRERERDCFVEIRWFLNATTTTPRGLESMRHEGKKRSSRSRCLRCSRFSRFLLPWVKDSCWIWYFHLSISYVFSSRFSLARNRILFKIENNCAENTIVSPLATTIHY